jgi:hypothetical protein
MSEEYDRVIGKLTGMEKKTTEESPVELDLKIAISDEENFFHEDEYNKAVEKVNRIVAKITALEKEQKGKSAFFLHEKDDSDKVAAVKNFKALANNTYGNIFKRNKGREATEIKGQSAGNVSGKTDMPEKTKAADSMSGMGLAKIPENIQKDILKAVDSASEKARLGSKMIDSVIKQDRRKKPLSGRPEDLSPLDQINLLNKIIDSIGKGEVNQDKLQDYIDTVRRIKKNAEDGNTVALGGADSYIYKMREERIDYAWKILDSYSSKKGNSGQGQ